MSGRLVICATPIGNLDDAPPRLADALGSAAVVYAEDTRRSRRLLERFGVDVPLRSYFVGNELQRSRELTSRLQAGDTVALITDAGTPGVSDPGVSAVRAAIAAGAEVTVIPGPSAVTAALAVAGLGADRFTFEGFLPRGQGARRRRLEELATEPRTMVIFSAPTRVAQDLADLGERLGAERAIVVCRELTKLHEEVYRGSLAEAAARWGEAEEPRGEFTLVVAGAVPVPGDVDALVDDVEALVHAGRSLADAAREVSRSAGVSRRALYEAVLRARGDA